MKKKIAAFLLATFVAFSSFAQDWVPIGVNPISVLSVRNMTKMNAKGELTAEFRLDYTVKVKTPEGEIVDHSFMKVAMNCFSRGSKLIGDAHVSEKGVEFKQHKNAWVNSGVNTGAAVSAATLVMDKVCPKGTGKIA